MKFIKINCTTKNYLDIVQILALVVGLGFAGYQLSIQNKALDSNRQQLAIQSESAKSANRIASADFTLQLSKTLYDNHYDKISLAVNNHDSNYSLKLNGVDENYIDDYISTFDSLGCLVRDGVIEKKMAYDEFSYVIEKAWCNKEIKKYIDKSRTEDHITIGPEAFYSGFEELFDYAITRDKKTCLDIDKE